MNHTLTKAPLVFMTATASIPNCARAASFGDDVAFLKSHTEVIILSDYKGESKLAVVPGWQGHVMTSSVGGDDGHSFGWINRVERRRISAGTIRCGTIKTLPGSNAYSCIRDNWRNSRQEINPTA